MPDSAQQTGRVTCGTCSKTIKFPLAKAGNAAKCPSCGEMLRLVDASVPAPSETPEPVPATTLTTDPTPPSRPAGGKRAARTETINVPVWAKPVALAVVTFLLGYFAGREHLKYQISSAFRDAGNAFAAAFGADTSDQSSGDLRKNALASQAELEVAKLVIENSMINDGTIGPRSVVTFTMSEDWERQDATFKDRFATILNEFWVNVNPEEDKRSLKVVIE